MAVLLLLRVPPAALSPRIGSCRKAGAIVVIIVRAVLEETVERATTGLGGSPLNVGTVGSCEIVSPPRSGVSGGG